MIPVGSLCVIVARPEDVPTFFHCFIGATTTVIGHTQWNGVVVNDIDVFPEAYCIDRALRIIRPPRNAQPAPPVTHDEPVTA